MPIELQAVTPVALVFAVLADCEQTLATSKEQLAQYFGPLRASSEVYAFDYTSYYQGEMGANLQKQLVCCTERIDPWKLAAIKTQTIELERQMARATEDTLQRRANIDPGLLSIESLVLATSKYSGHRICIAPQLYAELTLLYQKGRYQPFAWTYLDYQSETLQHFLLETRTWLMASR